jgi:SAM-dependent methyltransferase
MKAGTREDQEMSRELQTIYSRRFQWNQQYRQRIWRVLANHFFQRHIPPTGAVLDLGCGYGEFINAVNAAAKYGMDLNPASASHLAPEVRMLRQDCSARWELAEDSLDVVFTSNFFEHLPDKATLARTLEQARRCLKPGGRLIAMGPNIKYVPGAYWDFWDHYLPLTEASLSEGLETTGFAVEVCWPRFLPYTMVGAREYPPFFLMCYLKLPWVWRFFGKQFLVIAVKRAVIA